MFMLSIIVGASMLAAYGYDKVPKKPEGRLNKVLRQVDSHYQAFVRKRVDTLMTSSNRQSQTEELDADGIAEKEIVINRQLGISLGGFAASLVGTTGVPVISVLGFVLGAATLGVMCANMIPRAIADSWRQRRLKYHLVGTVITAVMALSGYFVLFGNLAILFYLVMFKFASRTEAIAQDSMRRTFGLQPPLSVWCLVDGIEVEVPFSSLKVGDIVVVHAGQIIPIDGVIVAGEGTVDQHALTGESVLTEAVVKGSVLANTLLATGRLEVRVEKAGKDTTAAQIGAILVDATTADFKSTSETERLVDGLAPGLLAVSSLSFFTNGIVGPIAIFNSGFSTPLMSGPLNMLSYLNIASERGILIKDGRSLEQLSDIDTVVFDKTGTLTIEEPRVAKIHIADKRNEREVLRLAAIAEHRQSHPIAKAILAEAAIRGIDSEAPEAASYAVGMGFEIHIDSHLVHVGSARFLASNNIQTPTNAESWLKAANEVGGSLVFVAEDKVCIGAIRLEAQLRPGTESLIAALKARKVKTCILSGDTYRPTEYLGTLLGVDQVFAEVLPEDKANVIRDLQYAGHSVCFVGDGLNDALALQQADVSISMRGATTLATDNAQIVLMSPSLSLIEDLFSIGRSFDKNLKRSMAFAFVPAGMVVGGVVLFGMSIPASVALFGVGVFGSVMTALAPLRHDGILSVSEKSNTPPK